MLIDTDLSSLGQYLKVEKSNLESKGTASVRSPVTRLRESSFTIDHLSFCEAVRSEFLKRYAYNQWRHNKEGEPIILDEAMIERNEDVKAIRDDMKTWKWTYGQTPEFTYWLEKVFPWGSVLLPLTALAVGMEGQQYESGALDMAIERIKDEAPEVLSPKGAVEAVKDVAQWLKNEL
ncbi:Biotin/lipoate A/B protein ligase [Mortierella sp. NVP85]|nr:Biotin/lipoate A/B protein ligase [Mortierella sp. NVP85]